VDHLVVMAASGIIGLGISIYLTFFVEDELHELQDKYAKQATKEKQVQKGGYEAQIEAFNYLHKEQETLISVDEKKIMAYGIMTGLNGLAMLLAIYEMTPFGAAGACKATTTGDVDVPSKPQKTGDGDTPDAPDKPKGGDTPDAPDKPKKGGTPDAPDKPKSSKFKEAATDVKDKKKVVGAFEAPDTPTGPTKPKAPDIDSPPKPKDPGTTR